MPAGQRTAHQDQQVVKQPRDDREQDDRGEQASGLERVHLGDGQVAQTRRAGHAERQGAGGQRMQFSPFI